MNLHLKGNIEQTVQSIPGEPSIGKLVSLAQVIWALELKWLISDRDKILFIICRIFHLHGQFINLTGIGEEYHHNTVDNHLKDSMNVRQWP